MYNKFKHKGVNRLIRSPEELSSPIKSAVDRRAVVFSHLLLAFTVTLHTWLAPNVPAYQKYTALGLGIGFVCLILFRFFDFARVNNRPKTYLVFYAIVIFIGIALISDPATPYALGAFMMVFWMNLYYGSKGVMYAIGFFAFITISKYFYLQSTIGLSYADKLNIIATLLVFIAISSLFVNIQKVFDWDRARLKETIRESAVEQKRLRALINNMTESVLVLDKEGIIRLYNAAALALFNTNNSLSDKPLDGFIKLEDEKGSIITTADLLPKNTRPIVRTDVVLRYSKDDAASLSIISTPIRSTFGQERDEEGYVITMRDITREKSLEEERDEFISVISHELRTPVTVAEAGVSNALLLAKKIQGSEKLTKSLQTAHDQSVFLANMLNDLTTFARAEKGTLELNLESFDPREMLSNLCNDYVTAVRAKGMNIITSADPSTPLLMASNRLYIREILQNFLTNAIKYSDKGTITLSARAKDKGVLYSVTDQGIGISVSDQKKVFEKFFRTEDYRTRSTNGTGLGLYIVKKLAKILDASFEVQSEVGKGSTFSIYVPDKADALAAKKAAEAVPVATTHVSSPAPVAASTVQTPAPSAAATPQQPPAAALSPAPTQAPSPPTPAAPTQTQ
ncbi:MAG: putative Multi-sensor signal transduction histidine kinase [Candidatus Saccharibacteria bacterium]|nr:putative Multi-sensor signal transduction histidine kinase [Candidatus Saccharibacteria bacterium]